MCKVSELQQPTRTRTKPPPSHTIEEDDGEAETDEPLRKRPRRGHKDEGVETGIPSPEERDVAEVPDPRRKVTPITGQPSLWGRGTKSRREKSGIGSGPKATETTFNKKNPQDNFRSLITNPTLAEVEISPALANVKNFNFANTGNSYYTIIVSS